MGEVVVNEKKLTVKESSRLVKLEGIIEENFKGFVAVGNALAEIREKRLYRNDQHRTFEGYCRELWEMSHQRADQFIAASAVIENLTTIVVKKKDVPDFILPVNEAQARELSRLEPEAQQTVWQEVLEEQKEQSQEGEPIKITASLIKKNVREHMGEKISGQIKKTTPKTPKTSKKSAGKSTASEEFLEAYNAFGEQIQKCHDDNWRSTSRSNVFENLTTLLHLVSKAGSKELKNNGCSMELSNREKLEKGGFRLFKMRPADLVIEEWRGGDTWMVAVSSDTPKQLSDAFKELMDDPKNLRA